MTKSELVKALAVKCGVSQAAASDMLDNVKAVITAELSAGRPVVLGSDFGTFKPCSFNGKVPTSDRTYSTKGVKFAISDPFKRVMNG